MVELRSLAVCGACQSQWYIGEEPSRCGDPDHNHVVYGVHRHCAEVVLPGGTAVTAASFDAIDPYRRDRVPDYGLYLDPHWQPPWDHAHLDWPDFGVPADPEAVVTALDAVLERAHRGQRVEIGCLGGHGRTGAALACLAAMSGLDPAQAVAWVRANYCAQAVETAEQEAFVDRLQI